MIADRGSSDVSVRLGFLAQKIIKKKKIQPLILYEFKQKKESKEIFNLFKYKQLPLLLVLRSNEFILLIKNFILNFYFNFKILIFGFDWFVKILKLKKLDWVILFTIGI